MTPPASNSRRPTPDGASAVSPAAATATRPARRSRLSALVLGGCAAAFLGAGVAQAQFPGPGGPGAPGGGGAGMPGAGDGGVPGERILGDQPLPKADPHATLLEQKRQGMMAYADGRYRVAATYFRAFVDGAWDESTLIDATTLLVKALLAQNRPADARAALAAVPERLPTLPEPGPLDTPGLEPLSRVVLDYWEARARLLEADLANATRLFSDVAGSSLSPIYKALGHLGLAECYMAYLDWARAEQAYRTARNLTLGADEERAASVGLLRVLVAQGKHEAADKLFAEIWPGSTGAYRNELGMVHLESLVVRDSLEQALTFFREHYGDQTDYMKSPDHVETVRLLAQNLASRKRYSDAIYLYRKLLPLVRNEERRQTILLGLADAYDQAGEVATAIAQYENFLKLYPNDTRRAKLYVALGRLQERAGKPDLAAPYFQSVYDTADAGPTLRFAAGDRLARIATTADANDRAAQLWEAIAALEVPDDRRAEALYLAGRTRLDKLNDMNEAANLFDNVATKFANTPSAPAARYHQGVARQREKRYDLAAQAFAQFIAAWADDPIVQIARLQMGRCQRLAGLYTEALATLNSYANDYPKADDAPLALLEASNAANAAAQPKDALDALDKIVTTYKESALYPRALYERAYLRLAFGMHREALDDSLLFLSEYGETHPDMAADVYLWLGDHHAALAFQGTDPKYNFTQAETFFDTVTSRYPNHPEAANALYEAAKNAYYRNDSKGADSAIEKLDRLEKEYPNAPVRILARGKFLRGDIASLRATDTEGFVAAAALFDQAAQLVPRSELYYAAKGRRAECFYTIASATDEQEAAGKQYQKALDDLMIVIDSANVPPSLVEKARYRAGKIYEKLKQPDKAIEQYHKIFYAYKLLSQQGAVYDWFYFARSGFDLARLFEEGARYASAIAVYEDLGKSDIPIAKDARDKAEALRKQYL